MALELLVKDPRYGAHYTQMVPPLYYEYSKGRYIIYWFF